MTKRVVFRATLTAIMPVAAIALMLGSGHAANPHADTAAPPAPAGSSPPASALPNGASSLQETYQDWQVNCVQQGTGKRCALTQQQTDQRSHQRVLAIELDSFSTHKSAGALVMPFGLALDRGVTFQIDDGAVGQPMRFRTCLPAGCIVPISFDSATIAALRKGTSLKIAAAIAEDDRDAGFTVSLKGFSDAFDRAAALTH
jgi:invasion protein IalB